jgi:transcriptional regulator with XRE-family HTH domain
MSFADQLKKAREKAGLSIADAAKGRGVSPRTWAYWEAGLRLPPAERDAITRERLLSSLTKERSPGPSNTRDNPADRAPRDE